MEDGFDLGGGEDGFCEMNLGSGHHAMVFDSNHSFAEFYRWLVRSLVVDRTPVVRADHEDEKFGVD